VKLFASSLESFPSPMDAGPEGLVAVSETISTQMLLEAYSFGIFPWPMSNSPTLWFSPEERGIIDFADFHEARSLRKWIRQANVRFTWNRHFSSVIGHCQRSPRPGQTGTWITPRLKKAYNEFHEAGYAHSLECWREGELIGGLYGVYVAGAFCGESMFFLEPNASKACLVYLVEFLGDHGLSWFDTQMITPTIESMGGKTISRADYLARLEAAKSVARPILFRV
jgi:leucyl/phenylalanyl-tRNA---protein transferase